MTAESYLTHPTFGLLYRICELEDSNELFTTLYAQRMFFLVAGQAESLTFQTISRAEARMMVDNRLRLLRRDGLMEEYERVQVMNKQTFSS
jgi:PII interaction protein X